MILYISGPMTGYPEYNYPKFNFVANMLRDKGFEVINPAELGNAELTWEQNMKVCLEALSKANAIVILPKWYESKGATVEVALGLILGMKVYDESMCEMHNIRERINEETLIRLMGAKQ